MGDENSRVFRSLKLVKVVRMVRLLRLFRLLKMARFRLLTEEFMEVGLFAETLSPSPLLCLLEGGVFVLMCPSILLEKIKKQPAILHCTLFLEVILV